jgi:hypothetical protein
MVLTFAIANIVLLALFWVMHSQYSHAQAGRDALEEASLARAILTRISSDIVNNLGPVDPRFLPRNILPNNANASAGGGKGGGGMGGGIGGGAAGQGSQGGGAQGGTQAAGGSGSTSNPSSGSSSSSNGSSSSTSQTPIPFNLGVKGDATWLVLSANRVPGTLLLGPKSTVSADSLVSSDLRNISYWKMDEGLARREMTAVTSDEAPTGEPDFANPSQYIIAAQVQDILFEYFDGSTWQASWDGTQLGGSDGNTPIGPPAAIRITLTLRSGRSSSDDNTQLKQYVSVVPLPATNAMTQAIQQGEGMQVSGQTLGAALQSGQTQQPAQQTGQSGATSGQGQ